MCFVMKYLFTIILMLYHTYPILTFLHLTFIFSEISLRASAAVLKDIYLSLACVFFFIFAKPTTKMCVSTVGSFELFGENENFIVKQESNLGFLFFSLISVFFLYLNN